MAMISDQETRPSTTQFISSSDTRCVLLTGPSHDGWWEITMLKRSEPAQPWEQKQCRLPWQEMWLIAQQILGTAPGSSER